MTKVAEKRSIYGKLGACCVKGITGEYVSTVRLLRDLLDVILETDPLDREAVKTVLDLGKELTTSTVLVHEKGFTFGNTHHFKMKVKHFKMTAKLTELSDGA